MTFLPPQKKAPLLGINQGGEYGKDVYFMAGRSSNNADYSIENFRDHLT